MPPSSRSGTSVSHRTVRPSKLPGPGYPSHPVASMRQVTGWFPLNDVVSTSTAVTTPCTPSRTIAQSSPGPRRRRRVSHPSTSSPRGPYRPGCELQGPGSRRCSFSPKDSSLAATTVPPTQREARSHSPAAGPGKGVEFPVNGPSGASRRSAWVWAARTSSACWWSSRGRRRPPPAGRRPPRRPRPGRPARRG